MVKQGPCGHCGVSTTPLWRNGPPDKPVLCNACGSRWRTKGTLLNYMPMHSGGCGGKNGSADRSLSHERKHFQQFKEHRSHKRKEPLDGHSDLNFGSRKSDFYLFEGFEEDTSTRSSTGSGISYSEGCIQRNFGAGYWPLQDCPIPKKNRTSLYQHRPSPAKLTQMQSWFDSSAFICSTGEDLLVEYKPSSMAAEIGLGGMFIRQEAWAAQEQESIASSLMHENKDFSFLEAPRYAPSRVENPPAKFSEGIHKSLLLGEKEKTKQVPKRANARGSEKNCIPKKSFTENFSYNKHDVLRSCQSPLVLLELQDIVNFNTFMGLLTSQEQLQLMNYVSSVDASRAPESLKHMFDSSQFKSDLVNFQRLLSGGMFDSLESGLSPCVLHQYQQLLTLTDLGASGWMERCFQIVDCNKVQDSLDIVESTQGKRSLKEKVKGASAPGAAVTTSATAFGVYKNLPGRPTSLAVNGGGETVRNSVFSHAISNSASPSMLSDSSYVKDWNACELSSNERPNSSRDTDGTETVDKSGSCFSSNGFYSSTDGIGCVSQHDTMKSLMDDMVEPDILIDLPSNISFQQAELLQKPLWDRAQPIKEPGGYDELKPTGSGSLMTTNIWQAEDNLDWAGLFWNPSITGSGHLL